MLSYILTFLFACGSDPILNEVSQRKEETQIQKKSSDSKITPPKPIEASNLNKVKDKIKSHLGDQSAL